MQFFFILIFYALKHEIKQFHDLYLNKYAISATDLFQLQINVNDPSEAA